MKIKILLTVGLLIFFSSFISSRDATQSTSEKEIITIWCTPDVQQLASTFIAEYGRLHINLDIQLMPLTHEFPANLNETNGLAFVSQKSGISVTDHSLLKMVVGRDVIVPVLNAKNPYLSTIDKKGISASAFREAVTSDRANWNILVAEGEGNPLKLYVPVSRPAQSAIAEYLDVSPEIFSMVETKPADEIIRLVQKDEYTIGFCRLNDLTEPGQLELPENVRLLPIDKNENGQIDYHEKIYGDIDDFKRGLWIGKYPGKLVNKVFSISQTEPKDKNVADFLSWVVTDGQQFLEPNGFSELVYNERQSRLAKITPQQITVVTAESESSRSKIYLLTGLALLVVAVVTGMVYQRRTKRVKINSGPFSDNAKILDEKALSVPKGMYFDKSHTWVFMEKEGVVRLGIDDFIPNVTGDYTRIILKNPGDKVKRKEPVVTLVQKGKQINIHAPVSGTIKEINEVLVTDPNTINHSPYEEGWIYMIEPNNWQREISFFKMGDAYKEWIRNEISRLKDFLACSLNIKNLAEGAPAYQEGGELVAQTLKEFGPKVWEDFQSYFIDSSDMY